jgi:hypothetical protein
MPNPLAPISHHWFDGSHISFGVLSAGLFGERWKLEGSLFNGRTPDEERLDLDLASLNAFAGRVWWLPSERWALQVSAGRFDGSGAPSAEPSGDVTRYTASATYHQRLGELGLWATTLAAGRTVDGAVEGDALLLESSLTIDERHTFFGRTEWVEKSDGGHGHDQAQDALLRSVGSLAVGYTLHLRPLYGLLPGVGARASLNVLPAELEPVYGTRNPMGFTVFVNLRPSEMAPSSMPMPME